ncbi:hypothetical protein [Paraflavitalea sp. CAU 1676]|uniref:hypothetical protein n=1 Tax=Paraflavitalea sp. CAU 1676 TaxID=3032598 RepID=UPI0023DA276E|nr:hypothetical protein [Paraflavitalea sp. CAU 1676]MDF2188608.1 hypothetical protein [Paraflavitalea sp. CAU 1676]
MASRLIAHAVQCITYKGLCKSILVAALIFGWFDGMAQKAVYPDSLLIDFDFFEGKIDDTSQLRLTLTFRNVGKSVAYVDSVIEAEIRPDHFYFPNLSFEFEEYKDGKYVNFRYRYSCHFADPDIISKVTRPYGLLNPGETTTRTYNVFIQGISSFTGKYRMRVSLLKLPMISTTSFTTEFYRSRWFTFEITRPMQIIYNEDGSIRSNTINK